jgi:predicted phosphoribosyltransferase
MAAALRATRARKPKQLLAAVPVAAPDSLEMIAPLTDGMVYLAAPMNFRSVSLHYRSFPQVSEEEVLRLLTSE